MANKNEQRAHATRCLEILVADYGLNPIARKALELDEVCYTVPNADGKDLNIAPICFTPEIEAVVASFEDFLGASVYHCFLQDGKLYMCYVGCNEDSWQEDIELLKIRRIRVGSYDLKIGIMPLFLVGIKEIMVNAD